MQELSLTEIVQVSGGITDSQVLNIGAATTAVGAVALGALATVAASPAVAVAGVAYGLVSGGMWLGSALIDGGYIKSGGGGKRAMMPGRPDR